MWNTSNFKRGSLFNLNVKHFSSKLVSQDCKSLMLKIIIKDKSYHLCWWTEELCKEVYTRWGRLREKGHCFRWHLSVRTIILLHLNIAETSDVLWFGGVFPALYLLEGAPKWLAVIQVLSDRTTHVCIFFFFFSCGFAAQEAPHAVISPKLCFILGTLLTSFVSGILSSPLPLCNDPLIPLKCLPRHFSPGFVQRDHYVISMKHIMMWQTLRPTKCLLSFIVSSSHFKPSKY